MLFFFVFVFFFKSETDLAYWSFMFEFWFHSTTCMLFFFLFFIWNRPRLLVIYVLSFETPHAASRILKSFVSTFCFIAAYHVLTSNIIRYRDICTLTDFATMFGPSSYKMLCLSTRNARRMLAGWKLWHAIQSFSRNEIS